jgi:hypothetical protein
VASPERAAALVPPVRETAAREPQSTHWLGHGQPTVRYPHAVRVAVRPIPTYRVAAAGDWLVDPSEWFSDDERERMPEGPAATAPTGPPAGPPADEPSIESPHRPAIDEPAIDEPEIDRPPDEPALPLDESVGTLEPADEELKLPAEEPQPVPAADESQPAEPAAPPPLFAPPTVEPAEPPMVKPPVDGPSEPMLPPPSEPRLPPETDLSPPPEPSPTTSPPLLPTTSQPEPSTPLFPSPAAPLPYGAAPPAATSSPAAPYGPTTNAPAAAPGEKQSLVDPHLELFAKNAYPSARECAKCHEEIYEQWSVSAHAYANVSPMFHKFEQKLNDLSQGTVGYFCMRCHAPVATALCVSRDEPLWNLPEVAREGVTCIACHRVQYMYGKSNGERRIETGPIFAPVFGGLGGDGVADAVHRREHFKVKTSPDEKGPGQEIHVTGIYFEQLTRSEFCASCHQVAVHPGIKLEVVWEQYRASPACKKGIQCQDCHMGRVPGRPLGYDIGPVAKIADKTVNDNRRKSNHIFHGPNYPIAHPGVFPFHLKADRWNIGEWLTFDWRAGWGTDEFEDAVADGKLAAHFPPVWAESDDRYDAREIIEDNLKKLNRKREIRIEIMENGSHVDGPFFDSPPCRGQDLKFHYVLTNTNEGHNLLTASLGAQPQLWANIVLIGPDGRRLWETGYTDSYGDLANIHSVDVRHRRVPFDWQLMNLQTMFLITGVKGTDREFFLPVNIDVDQLPFIRPGAQPISTINHPPFIRMESQSLAPLGSRRVPYKVPGELLRQPGSYRLTFRMRSRAEPPYFMRFCEATPDMLRSMNEWMVDVHPMTVEFYVR